MTDVPVPDTTAEEEFDLFGPGPSETGQGHAQTGRVLVLSLLKVPRSQQRRQVRRLLLL